MSNESHMSPAQLAAEPETPRAPSEPVLTEKLARFLQRLDDETAPARVAIPPK